MTTETAAPYKYRYQLYQALYSKIAQINADARRVADDIGIPKDLRGKIGLTGSVSSCHALLRRDVSAAMEKAAREVVAALCPEHLPPLPDAYDA